ncbi:DC-STAMP domain-containing protein 2-like [Anoplophora glabripennis]|uniref:DC-STAMP domain-containing protein 2-like n=1 Tax=Anoplophora glabripennis TaxID=217634 RepID=UPI0008754D4C|nr:DC-STAMP domain-containing protein 2-like [Anoplophora glabripennis]
MAFMQLIMTASKLNKLKQELVEEKTDAIKVSKKLPVKKKFRHRIIRLRMRTKRFLKKMLGCFFFEKFCYTLRHDGSCENYTLKSIAGFVSGFVLTYIFFMFCMFQLNFTLPTATIFCSILGCILMLGLAFSTKVRCVVLLTLPQFFSQKGRQALLAYAFILAISGPAWNMLNNMGILSDSLACGQEQLKQAVRQIIDVIKKPFIAFKEAIKKVIKTVKEIMITIKEILLKIKRVIMAIIKVIKAAFQFLAKIINICNKELGTPFERCTRVFENAIADCSAKLGPLFSWLCSIAYIVQSVCYLVKFLDLICMIVDFISDSIVGVVIRKVKTFIRHVKTMFYVRIKISHSFEFQTNSSKTVAEIAHAMTAEVRQRTEVMRTIFKFMTSAATVFFLFLIIKVTYYRFKFLTSEKFDNKYINKDFREIDMRRAKLGKETVLPLNDREMQVYVAVSSKKLAKSEKKALAKAASSLATVSLKLAIFMAGDYSLFWILNLIKYYGKFQSKVQAPNMPSVHVAGNGFLADLLRSIVKAFQPAGINLEIDTVPCLPTPIPPNYDRYVQIATIIVLCWVLALLEPYGLRLRHIVMCYYHPVRAKQRAIWLYNHIMRARNSFLKLARRQLRRKILGDGSIAKITCKEYLAANFKSKITTSVFRICALCLGEHLQQCCLLCGEVFRESDNKKPIKCHTPNCPGIYCEQCFADLQNLCTICLSPIEYGDLSDISEEKDSSEEEPKPIIPKPIKKSKWRQLFFCSKCCQKCFPEDDEEEGKSKSRSLFGKKKDAEDKDSSDEEGKLLKEELNGSVTDGKYDEVNKMKDSDYYSSDSSTDYSYSYQYDKTNDSRPVSIVTPFKDVEKQEVPDYASMSSFREEADETEQPKTTLDKATAALSKQSAGTVISGTTFEENRKDRKVEFVGVPDRSKVTVRKKKKKRRPRTGEERPLLSRDSCPCTSSDTDDSDLLQHLQSPVLTLLKSSSTLITQNTGSPYTLSSEDKVKPSLASTVGAEIKSDVRYVEALIPQLDLSQVQCIHIPGCDTITSSSLDSEIKCNHEYVKMMVPELDLSSLTSTPHSSKNYVNNIFGNVKYDEVSESPKSTSSSSRHHNSSPDVSSENKYLNTRHSTTKVDKDIQTSTKAKVDIGVSAKPLDKYKFEEKQRKKVKQYYRAVKDIPSDRKAEDKRKSGKFMKFVQKIIPKAIIKV